MLVIVVGVLLALLILVSRKSSRLRSNINLALDLADLFRLLVTLRVKAFLVRDRDWSVVDMFEESAAIHGDKPAITMANPLCSVSYSELDGRANQIARWAIQQRLGRGDAIALVMPSCVDYVAMWLGVAKIGACAALVNIHTKGPPLVHAIQTVLASSNTKLVVVDQSLAHNLLNPCVLSELGQEVRIVAYGKEDRESAEEDLLGNLATLDQGPLPTGIRKGIRWDSTLLYVYTSGTTGLPKASKISHLRFFSAATLFSVTARLRPDDRVYCSLPLYHSSGGMLGVGGCWKAGCSLVVRGRFSVSEFASDCVRHKCTVVQYIGEVARYLVNSQETASDQQCQIRVAFGNGLRPDVWKKFQKRYGVKRIVEFYASTEGNVNMVNNTGKAGAVGVVPWFAERIYPVRLLRMSPDQETLARDKSGKCIKCRPGEVGQIVGLINNQDPARRFDGYTDPSATASKIVHNVMRPGDTYFASGDLLRKDAFGYFYWVDRIGDTYRWKGENVATTEVAQVMCSFPGVADVNVYGVAVPGAEGKVGMATMKLKGCVSVESFDWQALVLHLDANLPQYAQPQFVRLPQRPSLTAHMTTTFKHIKTQLRREGFDPEKVGGDYLLFRDRALRTYVAYTPDLHAAICNGALRL